MPAMVLNFPTAGGEATLQYRRFYTARAQGGVGLIVVGALYVDRAGRGFPDQLGIHDDALLPALRRLTDDLHAHGAAAFAQLSFRCRERTPADFSLTDIARVVEAYAAAARRAQRAGFDGVELHACHDYLLNHFLSPATNRRSDDFGLGLSGRAKLLIDVLQTVKAVAGTGFPVSCRLSGEEYIPGGITLAETEVAAKKLRAAGADAIHVSAGVGKTTQYMIPPMEMPSGLLLPLAAAVRRAAGPPVIAVAKIDSLELGEAALAQGQADFVALGRSLLADPDLPRRYEAGDTIDVRPCIRCNVCVERIRTFSPAICAVNPSLGREGELRPTDDPRPITVIGAGPAGVQAALVLHARGHAVTLWERGRDIGGKLCVGALPPHKEVLASLVAHWAHAIRSAGISLRTGQPFEDGSGAERPHSVVVATGAQIKHLSVPGIHSDAVIPAEEVLRKGPGDAQRFLIVGGGLVGLETAEYLMVRGRAVVVIEQLDSVGQGLVSLRRDLILARLREGGVQIRTRTPLVRLEGDRVVVIEDNREQVLDPFDRIVLAAGYVRDPTVPAWALRTCAHVRVVGDALEPRNIPEATLTGYEAGMAF
jgi:2,4-dienoyl-CoA reductase-like NADH-dependent reductase (Old Yellow Enzyme family)